MKWLATWIAIATVAVGCGGLPMPASVPRSLVTAGRYGGNDMHCTRIDQVLYLLPRVVQVRGCDQRREYLLDSHRRPVRAITNLIDVAARTMHCAPTQLDVQSPAPAVRAIDGCGRRARFDLECAAHGCEWTMTAHTGRWSDAVGEAAAPGNESWQPTPEGVTAPITAPEGYVDLLTVDVPSPPATTVPDAITAPPP